MKWTKFGDLRVCLFFQKLQNKIRKQFSGKLFCFQFIWVNGSSCDFFHRNLRPGSDAPGTMSMEWPSYEHQRCLWPPFPPAANVLKSKNPENRSRSAPPLRPRNHGTSYGGPQRCPRCLDENVNPGEHLQKPGPPQRNPICILCAVFEGRRSYEKLTR